VALGADEGVAVGRRGVAVLAGEGGDDGAGVSAAAHHLLPRLAVDVGVAPVVAARVRDPLITFCPYLPCPAAPCPACSSCRHISRIRVIANIIKVQGRIDVLIFSSENSEIIIESVNLLLLGLA
jgi:hypothetical protein